MADEARAKRHKFVRLTARVRDDLQWWQRALKTGFSSEGVSIMQRDLIAVRTVKADAGTEWGLGAHDDSCFYKAKHTQQVLSAAMRKSHHSSQLRAVSPDFIAQGRAQGKHNT